MQCHALYFAAGTGAALSISTTIAAYRARLGCLLGSRFLIMTHTGRISGLPRQTVLDVIYIGPTKGSYYLLTAYAEHSD